MDRSTVLVHVKKNKIVNGDEKIKKDGDPYGRTDQKDRAKKKST